MDQVGFRQKGYTIVYYRCRRLYPRLILYSVLREFGYLQEQGNVETSATLSQTLNFRQAVAPSLMMSYTPFTRYNRLSNRLSNRFDNRIDNRLYRVNGALSFSY